MPGFRGKVESIFQKGSAKGYLRVSKVGKQNVTLHILMQVYKLGQSIKPVADELISEIHMPLHKEDI